MTKTKRIQVRIEWDEIYPVYYIEDVTEPEEYLYPRPTLTPAQIRKIHHAEKLFDEAQGILGRAVEASYELRRARWREKYEREKAEQIRANEQMRRGS